ncbi:hypothetical protein K435DRAFT_859677 [Dendrothele bispora CBS 962.96]|uniref:Uncharacterized protein n=1 Tax=Dendrothele bispora (strain CBS 962.96) TaxID=1314807 RepID=A0A4S8LZW6_DENBC|nr:hypothetical protein K435DRAFT_859677 [Dendrothele bispora CBS 962.96]
MSSHRERPYSLSCKRRRVSDGNDSSNDKAGSRAQDLQNVNSEVSGSEGESTHSMAENDKCTGIEGRASKVDQDHCDADERNTGIEGHNQDHYQGTDEVSEGSDEVSEGSGNMQLPRGADELSGDSGDMQLARFVAKFKGSVTTWVESVDGADFVEEYLTKEYSDAAVQTGLPDETPGVEEIVVTASLRSYGDLEDSIVLAQQAASAAWDKYWSAEVGRFKLEEAARMYKKQRDESEEERSKLAEIANRYKGQRDLVVDRLCETIRDKKKAEAESKYWRKKIREIGQNMEKLSDKTLNFTYDSIEP